MDPLGTNHKDEKDTAFITVEEEEEEKDDSETTVIDGEEESDDNEEAEDTNSRCSTEATDEDIIGESLTSFYNA
jgi:hypothetical protein